MKAKKNWKGHFVNIFCWSISNLELSWIGCPLGYSFEKKIMIKTDAILVDDAVNQGNWGLSIKLILECFVIVE